MITLKLFGTLRVDAGIKELQLEGNRVKDLYAPAFAAIRERNPNADITLRKLKNCNVAVNGTLVSPGTKLKDGDEVYFFPAVAGG